MRNPYKPRPDHTKLILSVLAGMALLTAAMVAFYLMRPPISAAQQRSEIRFERQVEQAEAVAARKEHERVAALLGPVAPG